jgi:flagellar basal body P-ring protein FlgI
MRSLAALLAYVAVATAGCSWWDGMVVRSQSPDEQAAEGPKTRLVGDLAAPFGLCMYPVEVEGVGLVTGLNGTGSDPIPSPQRQVLLGAMQARGVQNPNAVLASPDTAMVLVRGVLRAGIQEGDHFDVEVRVLEQSETTSLRGGWLLPVEMKEFAVLSDNRVHTGHVWGQAAGAIMVDPSAEGQEDRVMRARGRILGGGVARKSRPLALELKPDCRSVINSARVETAINKRFRTSRKGVKVPMAKAKTDRCVELTVHPRYRDNFQRYMQVVRSIALRESEAKRQERLTLLEKQLLDPISSSRAALQLEAIGSQAVEALGKGIASENPEVRFYSAQALAYLDRSEAAEPLAEAARQQPAFRVFALSALSMMDDLAAADQLRELLNGSSAETRYGAFRALWSMKGNAAALPGEILGGQFSYHVLDTAGTPMIHVTRSRRPEVVLFGKGQRLQTPFVVEAGNQIMVVGTQSGEVAVSKFAIGEMDQKRIVSNDVDAVIRKIVELGGTYPDVVQALQSAKEKGALASRFEVDALPEAGRTYDRLAEEEPSGTSDVSQREARSEGLLSELPAPLGGSTGNPQPRSGGSAGQDGRERLDSAERRQPVRAFFAKMVGREKT